MASWLFKLGLLALVSTTLVVSKGGGRGGGGGSRGGGGGSRGGGSKSGGSTGGGSSYPRQDWKPAPAPAPSPPRNPSYPSQNPSYPSYPGSNSGPSYNPHNPSYNPGYPAPPAYSPPGHAYPAPPPYSPGGGGYPSGPRPPSYPSYPPSNPSYPVPPSPMKPPKSGGSIGQSFAAGAAGGVVGGVVGGVIGSNLRPQGPRVHLYVPVGGYHHHGGYRGGSSSSEEYFQPYYTGPDGRFRVRERPGYTLSDEGRRIIELARALQVLCEKLQQPSACTALKLQGVRPFTHPNSMFNEPVWSPKPEEGRNNTALDANHPSVIFNGPVFPVNQTSSPANETVNVTSLYPEVPKLPDFTVPTLGTTLIPPAPLPQTEAPHLTEDRLKAADDLLKALDG